ncbi:MAG TPA: hypothetical protein VN081_02245 [Dongiaceae bacterium]|nr:hypothetical protein [Dongiaceae bacterium]
MADAIDWDALVKDKLDGGVETPAEAAPETPPAAPAAPAEGAPATPPEPVTPPAEAEKTDEEKAEEARLQKEAEDAEAELAKNETPEQTEARHKKAEEDATAAKQAEDEAAAAAAEPKPLTADDLNKALDARDQQVKFDAERYKTIESEVAKDLYPNGFDTTLKDEAGHVIANAADYKQYIDPNATTEEAERVIMNEQARLNGEIQQAKNFIAEKAELKHSMENDAVRVFNKYKDFFLKYPDVQPKIAASYYKTLKIQGTTIMDAPQSLEDFYDFAMEPYLKNLPQTAPAAPATPAPATPPAAPKSKVNDESLDLMGAPSGQDDGMVKSDGSPNWEQITKAKMKG